MTVEQQLQFIIDNMVNKTEFQSLKADVQSMKTDVESLKTDVQSLKTELKSVKIEIQSVKMELYDELNRQYIANDKRFTKIESMSNTLLLQEDNTAFLLSLMNRQSEEMEVLKSRVTNLEMKFA